MWTGTSGWTFTTCEYEGGACVYGAQSVYDPTGANGSCTNASTPTPARAQCAELAPNLSGRCRIPVAQALKDAQRAFLQHRREGLQPGRVDGVSEYVLPAGGARTRLARLANLLVQQGVEVHVAESELACEDAGPAGGDARSRRTFPAGSFVVRMAQPASTLARLLLRPHFDMQSAFLDEQKLRKARRERGQFYDLTAGSLPLLFGVECFESHAPCRGALAELEDVQAAPEWHEGAWMLAPALLQLL